MDDRDQEKNSHSSGEFELPDFLKYEPPEREEEPSDAKESAEGTSDAPKKEPIRLIRGTDEGKPLEIEVVFDKEEKKSKRLKKKPSLFGGNKRSRRTSSGRRSREIELDRSKEGEKEEKLFTREEEVSSRREKRASQGRHFAQQIGRFISEIRQSFRRNTKAWTYGILGVVVLIAFILIINGISKKGSSKQETLVLASSVSTVTGEVSSVNFDENGLALWDRHQLSFYNPEGEEVRHIENPQLGRVFFGNHYIYAVNHMTQDLTLMDQTGEGAGYISGEGFNLFHIEPRNGYDLVHQKGNGIERLSMVTEDQALAPLFETQEFILTYDLEKPENYVVASMITKGNGYRSRITWMTKGTERVYDFNNEVIIKLDIRDNDIYAVTNENLYWIRNEEEEKVEISLFKNMIIDGKQIWVLHGDVLEGFNRQLTSQRKIVTPIEASDLTRKDNMNIVHNSHEVVGYYPNREEMNLYYKADLPIVDVQSYENHVALIYRDHVDVMEIVPAEELETETPEGAPEEEAPQEGDVPEEEQEERMEEETQEE